MAKFPKEIILATKNRSKIIELKSLISELKEDIRVYCLDELPRKENLDREEKFSSYLKNSKNKAISVALSYKKAALADDSGIEIKFLGNLPGIKSSLWGGDISPRERNILILERLKRISWENRVAKFISYLVLALPEDEGLLKLYQGKGEVKGYIAEELRGERGFGYDPIFFYSPLGKTFGELTLDEKNKVSHRALAFHKLVEIIQNDLYCRVRACR